MKDLSSGEDGAGVNIFNININIILLLPYCFSE